MPFFNNQFTHTGWIPCHGNKKARPFSLTGKFLEWRIVFHKIWAYYGKLNDIARTNLLSAIWYVLGKYWPKDQADQSEHKGKNRRSSNVEQGTQKGRLWPIWSRWNAKNQRFSLQNLDKTIVLDKARRTKHWRRKKKKTTVLEKRHKSM